MRHFWNFLAKQDSKSKSYFPFCLQCLQKKIEGWNFFLRSGTHILQQKEIGSICVVKWTTSTAQGEEIWKGSFQNATLRNPFLQSGFERRLLTLRAGWLDQNPETLCCHFFINIQEAAIFFSAVKPILFLLIDCALQCPLLTHPSIVRQPLPIFCSPEQLYKCRLPSTDLLRPCDNWN